MAPDSGGAAPDPSRPDALLGAIEARAEEERARLIADAEESARGILAEADAECQRLTREAMEELDRELVSEQQRLLGAARMNARARGLERRRALVSEAFRQAAEEIDRRARGPEGPAAAAALAQEARAAVGEPCSVQTAADGSIRAVSADGRRSVENSLRGRLERARSVAEHEVARRLFGGGTEAAPAK
jgi:vacuolar-type H+-ATPase subunit E/Vma4